MALKDDLKNMSFLQDTGLPKIKISPKVASIIVIIISMLIFYWMHTSKLPEIRSETEKIQNENIPLAATEENLNKLYANMNFYIKETGRLTKEYDNAIAQFPPYMYLEDKVHFINELRNGDFKGFGTLEELTYGESTFVSNGTGDATQTDSGEGGGQALELYAVPISGQFININYSDLKSFMTYGLTSDRRFVLDSISVHQSDDDTSVLSCEFSFKTFFLSGQEEPYYYSGTPSNEAPGDTSYLQGEITNPFRLK